MGYALTFIALLSVFLWMTPARDAMISNGQNVMHMAESVVASNSAPLQARIESMAGSLRNKAMELLRKELHQSVDNLVQ